MYHRAEVENSKNSYTEHDNLDVFLNAEGRALKANSVRIQGVLSVTKTAGNTRIANTDDIQLDNAVGVHALVDIISVEMANVGMVEQYSEYSRYVKMKNIANDDLNDYHSGLNLAEYRAPSEKASQALLTGFTSAASSATADDVKDQDFSFKPMCCLNAMSGDVSFAKTGAIKLSITLNKVAQVLYGTDVDANTKYTLSDVRVSYRTVPDVDQPVSMDRVLSLKSSINSKFSNTLAKVPAVVRGVSCCFMKQSRENDLVECNQAMDVLQGIKEVQFVFQDSTSQYISYPLRDKGQIIERFVESLGGKGHNQVNANNNQMNFGIGLSFPPVDLSNQKFNIQINSDMASLSTTPYIIYQYFHSSIQV